MSSPSFLAKSVVQFEKKKVKKKIGELLSVVSEALTKERLSVV